MPLDRGFKAALRHRGRRRLGGASEEPLFELGEQLLELELFEPFSGDPPKYPTRLVASVVMPDKRGVIGGDLLCDLSRSLLKQGPKILRLEFVGGRNEGKHVGGRAAHFVHVSHQHASRLGSRDRAQHAGRSESR